MKIGNFEIGSGSTFVIAEIGANHEGDYQKAVRLIHAAKEAGADSVKLQTYTANDMTIDCDSEVFRVCLKGSLWEGQTLYQLYQKAATPLDWFLKLKRLAENIGIILFSTPFSIGAVDFLEQVNVPCYKIASCEINDIALWERIAQTGKPVLFSTGASSDYGEISRASRIVGRKNCIPLHCVSQYPAPPEEMNLRTIAALSQSLGTYAGLSDHTKGIAIAIAGVALEAKVIEKHIKLEGSTSPDASFSITPKEFKRMVDGIRCVEKAVSGVQFKHTSPWRRSLYVTSEMKKDDIFTEQNVRSIRPSGDLEPIELKNVLTRKAKCSISRGTALSQDLII